MANEEWQQEVEARLTTIEETLERRRTTGPPIFPTEPDVSLTPGMEEMRTRMKMLGHERHAKVVQGMVDDGVIAADQAEAVIEWLDAHD